LGNAAALTLGAAIETVLQVTFLVIAGRELGPTEFGFYGYLISILTVVAVVAHFGLPVVAVRELAQRPEQHDSIFAATFRIRASLSGLFFVGAILIATVVPQSEAHRMAAWAIFLYLLFVPFDLSLLFDAHKLSRHDVWGKTAGRAASLLLLVASWKAKGELTVVDAALATSTLLFVNVMVGWWVARRIGFKLHPFAETREVSALARASAPIMWSNVMAVTYAQSQTIFVKWLSTDVQTGFFALGSRLLIPILTFKGILYRLLVPILSDVGRDKEAITASLRKILPALALIFMPIAALGIPAAEVLIVPVFGAEYAGAIRPFQITVSYLLFTGMSSVFGVALLASGDARTPTVGLTIGCTLSVALSFLMIPTYGAVGAAWASWIAEMVANLYTLPKFLRLAKASLTMRLWWIGASSLAGTVVYYAAVPFGIAPVIALISAVLAVAMGLWMAGEISPEKLRAVIELVLRRNA
jgi:O-antigen/teichoic acid export membrane protein